MGAKSRRKGAQGERELAEFLRDRGIEARRGQQYAGGPGSPDVVADLPDFYVESKRCEALSLYPALEKATAEAGDKIPLVCHRRNRKPWLAILHLEDLLELLDN